MRLMRFHDADSLVSTARLARRVQIAKEMARVAKASEAELPADERRQVIAVDLPSDAEYPNDSAS